MTKRLMIALGTLTLGLLFLSTVNTTLSQQTLEAQVTALEAKITALETTDTKLSAVDQDTLDLLERFVPTFSYYAERHGRRLDALERRSAIADKKEKDYDYEDVALHYVPLGSTTGQHLLYTGPDTR